MRSEQSFETLAQGSVAFAHDIEECGALGGWFGQCELEQEFFAVRVHVEVLLNWVGRRIDNR